MIKESDNLIGQETQLPHPTKSNYQKLPFLMVISMQKNLRDCLITSRDINDQRILKYDWIRDTTSHTQPKW